MANHRPWTPASKLLALLLIPFAPFAWRSFYWFLKYDLKDRIKEHMKVLLCIILLALPLSAQVKKPAHITCTVREVHPSFIGAPLLTTSMYGLTILACRDDKTGEKFTWEIPENAWPGVWGVHRHPGHIVRAGRDIKGNLIPACRVSQDCHPADQACLQTPLPANRTCDFHDEN